MREGCAKIHDADTGFSVYVRLLKDEIDYLERTIGEHYAVRMSFELLHNEMEYGGIFPSRLSYAYYDSMEEAMEELKREVTYEFRDGEYFDQRGNMYGMLPQDWHEYLVEKHGGRDGKYKVKSTLGNMKRMVEEWKRNERFSREKEKMADPTQFHGYHSFEDCDNWNPSVTTYNCNPEMPGYFMYDPIKAMRAYNGEKENMNNLYEMYVIDVPKQSIVWQDSVLATNAEQAKMLTLSDLLTRAEGLLDTSRMTDYQFVASVVTADIRQKEKAE